MNGQYERARAALAGARWQEAAEAFGDLLKGETRDPEALEGLGVAAYWLGDAERSFEVREEAYRARIASGDRRGAARIAMRLCLDTADYRGIAVATGWLQRAHSLLEEVPLAPEHGWLALWEGHFARAFEHDLDRASTLAARARSIAGELAMPDLDLLSMALEGLINVTAGNVRDGMRQLDEATAAALAGEISGMEPILVTCCFLMYACERVCDWDRAAQWGRQIDALARRWSLGTLFAECQAEHAAMLIGRGEWERAESDLQAAISVLEATRPLSVHTALLRLADLRRRQGRIDEAAELFNRFPSLTESILGLAAIALDRGDVVRAVELAEKLRRRPMAEKWVQRAAILEILARGGDRAAAAELRELARTTAIGLVLAMANCAEARLESDDRRARELFEDAVDCYDRYPAPWEAARTRLELAATLRRLGRDSFGAEEEAAARETLRRLGVASPRQGSPLTRRETEVLRLVAGGLSDKEVALRLKLSEHTVHRHVSNVLAKLQLPSRTAAVATAAREGWLSPQP